MTTKWTCHRCGTKTDQGACPVCGETLAEQQAATAFNPYVLSKELTNDDLAQIVVEAMLDCAFLDDVEAAVQACDREEYPEAVATLHVLREALYMLRDRLPVKDHLPNT